jgi:cyclopropane-fatty-acyl-phospholipid synthase
MNDCATTQSCSAPYAETSSLRDRLARQLVRKLLARIRYGRIVLHEGNQQTVYGAEHELVAHLRVYHPAFYRRVLFGGSIGGGEAYVTNLWDVDDLTALARIMVRNMKLLDRMEQGFAWLRRPFFLVRHLLRNNNKKRAKKNIIAHYDLGNTLYKSFLDPTMMYSAAIYDEEAQTLDQAAVNKLEVICRKLDLKPHDHLIEIGTGWGGLAIHAARNYGCQVTTTTLSEEQFAEASRLVAEEGLTDRIHILRRDYRDLTGSYDKLVSVEMIEAVGDRYLPAFFKKCEQLLKPDGIMLLQAITIVDQKYEQYRRSVDFIQRHIFPGGCLVSNRRMIDIIGGKTDMVVRNLEDYGFDYARTLSDWRHRFRANYAQLRKAGYDETFKRLWEFYLCYCEGGFRERAISVVQLLATRPQHRLALKR